MCSDEKPLANVLNESVKELQHRLDQHSCLIAAILDGQVDSHNLAPHPHGDARLSWSREEKFGQAIKEAIEVLEQSRKSFKSKELKILRKKLMQVLIDNQ
ncbi:MAG: hypothetical protein ACLFPI_10565 [Desulfobacterales bacterium]